jgi:hypothetical protein
MISHIRNPSTIAWFWSCRDTLRKHGVWTSRFGRRKVEKVRRKEHDISASTVKKVGGKKAHVQFMGVDDVQCQEVDMTVRVFYPERLQGVLRTDRDKEER